MKRLSVVDDRFMPWVCGVVIYIINAVRLGAFNDCPV